MHIPSEISYKEVLHPQNEEIPKMLEWFELTLKQKEIPTQRIRAYEIGADRWIDIVSDGLGEKGSAGSMTLYLDEKALRADAPEQEKTRNYTFDPATPVESIGDVYKRQAELRVKCVSAPQAERKTGKMPFCWQTRWRLSIPIMLHNRLLRASP